MRKSLKIALLRKIKNNGEAMINLAECYRKTNDVKNAVRVSAHLAHRDNPAPQNIWAYAQLLKRTSLYFEQKGRSRYQASFSVRSRFLRLLFCSRHLLDQH